MRGAPAIGIAAAFGMYVCANRINTTDVATFTREVRELQAYFATSVDGGHLFWRLTDGTAP